MITPNKEPYSYVHSTKIWMTVWVFMLALSNTFAADITWTNANGTNNWNDPLNWSTGGVPTTGDIAIFDITSLDDCNIDTNINLDAIDVRAGYTGTLTQQPGNAITVSFDLTVNGGDFVGGDGNVIVGTDLTIGAPYTSTSGTLQINGNFTLSGGSFSHNNGTVTFGGSTKTVTGTTTFNNLTLDHANHGAFNLNDDILVLGIFSTLSNNNTPINGATINLEGDASILNSAAGGGGTATIVVNGIGNQTITGRLAVGRGELPNITIDKPGGILTFDETISLTGNWTYLNGSIDYVTNDATIAFSQGNQQISGVQTFLNLNITHVSHGNFTLNDPVTVTGKLTTGGGSYLRYEGADLILEGDMEMNNSGGTYNSGSGTIRFSGSQDQTIIGRNVPPSSLGAGGLPNVVIDKTAGILTFDNSVGVNGNWTYLAGNLDYTTNDAVIAFTNRLQTISGTQTFHNLHFRLRNSITIADDIQVNGIFTYSGTGNGAINGTGTMNVTGDIAISNGSIYTGGTATVRITGSGNQSISSTSSIIRGQLPNVVIDKSGGTATFDGILSIGGNWEYIGGNVDYITNNATIAITFRNQTISGVQDFHNLRFHLRSSGSITMLDEITVTNLFTFSGATHNAIHNEPINILGDMLVSNTVNTFSGTGLLRITGANDQNITSMAPLSRGLLPNIEIIKTSGTALFAGIFSILGNFEYIDGSVDALTNGTNFGMLGAGTIDGEGTNGNFIFHDLTLRSSALRDLTGDVEVNNVLDIDDYRLNLNSNAVYLRNAASTAITFTNGRIVGDTPDNASVVHWDIGTDTTPHIIPFANNANERIPFTFENTDGGDVGVVSIATYPTDDANSPYPLTPDAVLNMNNVLGRNESHRMIDRFWQLDKSGIAGTVDIAFAYADSDISGSVSGQGNNLFAKRYNSGTGTWEIPSLAQTATAANNTVLIHGVTQLSPWSLFLFDDPDNDLVDSSIDLDDDNDGILDNDELHVPLGASQPDCTGETILDFSAIPVLESGTALTEGAVYRFPNVTASADAIVTIVETFNATVPNLDDNSSDPASFKPETAFNLANIGDVAFVEYSIEFVDTGATTPLAINKFFLNFNDVDGNANFAEQSWSHSAASYTVSSPTELSFSNEGPWVIVNSGSTEHPGEGNGNSLVNFGVPYTNETQISVRVGAVARTAGASQTDRQYNIEFRCLNNYSNPQTYGMDNDFDGVPNHIDLDTDNDGILDVLEAGHSQADGDSDGRIDGLPTDFGSNGLYSGIESDDTAGATVTYPLSESADDVDSIADFLDLDSDGDGIPDNVEAQTTIGYIVPNVTVDANGVDTAYTGGITPTNTDGADLPDYLDTDSDNEGGDDTSEAQITLLNADSDNDGLDDATDATPDYSDVGGTIDDPLSGTIILLDTDKDAASGGDVDFRDAQDDRLDTDTDGIADAVDLDDDNDGLLDSEELNVIVGNTQPDCTGETVLDFSTAPILESGTALQQGAVYRFPNVFAGTDALITIVETFNASVADIDNNAAEPQAFRPRTAFDISNVGKEGYIEYHMQFVNSGGTAAVTVPKFFININDTDGNVDYSEEIYVENPTNYIISNPTELSVSYEFPWVVATGGTTEYAGAGNTFPQINFGINYENRSEFRFRAGITTIIPAVAASGREHNLDFRCTTNYDNPEIHTLDTDGDGLPNPIDLDTDNDGIFDVTEAGHGQSQTNGRVNGTVGADGVPDAVQSDPDNGAVNYVVGESADDTDMLADFADLDADGDGLPDNVEAQTTIGYIAPNGTFDANGLDTAYTSGLVPTNTDGTDNPDYLDTDSDNEGGGDTVEATLTLSGNDIDSDGLDDATDADTSGYADPGGTIDDPLAAPVLLPDTDNDTAIGGDVDFRDALESEDLDSDDDGIVDSVEDLNADGDDDPSTDPTNSDGDSYPDYLDIDSDNDGIPDNVEAQTTSGYIPPSLTDANANGLDDAYETGVRLGLEPINTDGEDLPDYLDGDSDNDNVPDAIEAHDHDHDGIADVTLIGSDKDDDGLDDGYEGVEALDVDVNDEIDSPMAFLPNTDNDEELDYRDTDDDDDGIPTLEEDTNSDRNYANDDVDGNGTPDYLEPNYPDIEIFNVVTPNGDGVHDILTITGLEERPNNNIQIYNRWGVLLYTTDAYNTIGNYFDGTSLARLTSGKEEKLPTGTYFYIFVYEDTDGVSKTLTGYIYLN